MALLVTIEASDLRNVFPRAIVLFLLLDLCGLGEISSNSDGSWSFLSLMAILNLVFFPGLFCLFGLSFFLGLFLDLRVYMVFIRLVLLGIETDLEGPLSYEAVLIEVGTRLDFSSSLSLINCIN